MSEPGSVAALIVAAGSGTRAGGSVPKQYRTLAGLPVLAHALRGLRHGRIDRIQVVIGEGQESLYENAVDAACPLPLLPPARGGATRRESVRNGLAALGREAHVDRVLIHDAARPFLPAAVVDRLLAALDAHQGAVPVLPVVDTLARSNVDGGLGDPVSREKLWRVQTPQAFGFAGIVDAHDRWRGGEPSDDAEVARAAEMAVATVAGDRSLEKLTYDADFLAADRRLAARLVPRTGLGFDVHAFAPGDGLWLGGIRIPHERGLAGHSDADALLHAVTDALLGTIAAGDIGVHFPPDDPQWQGAASSLFLDAARDKVERAGGRIVHVDATVICETPRIGRYREAMRERIAALLRLPLAGVSIKGTTTERLGFAGRGEGIAVQAIVTVQLPEEP